MDDSQCYDAVPQHTATFTHRPRYRRETTSGPQAAGQLCNLSPESLTPYPVPIPFPVGGAEREERRVSRQIERDREREIAGDLWSRPQGEGAALLQTNFSPLQISSSCRALLSPLCKKHYSSTLCPPFPLPAASAPLSAPPSLSKL